MQPALQLQLDRLARPLRFGIVGVSGVAINSAILWVLVRELGLAVTLSSVIATEAAILSNFLLNDRWTFRAAAQQGGLVRRLLRFNGVALGGMAISTAVLAAVIAHGHLPLLLANLLAVGAAMGWNYAVNSRWTWGQGTGNREQGTGDSIGGSRQSAVNDIPLLSPAYRLLPTGDEVAI